MASTRSTKKTTTEAPRCTDLKRGTRLVDEDGHLYQVIQIHRKASVRGTDMITILDTVVEGESGMAYMLDDEDLRQGGFALAV